MSLSPELADKMFRFQQAGLYVVTSQVLSDGRSTVEVVKSCLRAGVSLFQLREKELPERDFLNLAHEIRQITADSGALLIINDHVETALAVGADGVHLGLDDTPLSEARAAAPDLIIGASTHSVTEALDAMDRGASYINIGPVFPTMTKEWNRPFLGLDGVREIASAVDLPFTVMGGIKKEHIPGLVAAGARTVAVITAVTAAENIEAAAADFLQVLLCSGSLT